MEYTVGVGDSLCSLTVLQRSVKCHFETTFTTQKVFQAWFDGTNDSFQRSNLYQESPLLQDHLPKQTTFHISGNDY